VAIGLRNGLGCGTTELPYGRATGSTRNSSIISCIRICFAGKPRRLARRLSLLCDFCPSARTFALGRPSDKPSRACPCRRLVTHGTTLHRHVGQISPNKNMSFWCATAAFTLSAGPGGRHHLVLAADLVFFANALELQKLNGSLREDTSQRKDSNRRWAAELMAIYSELPFWYRWVLQMREENPMEAGKDLIGLSNSSERGEAKDFIKDVKKNLRISHSGD
jgi:hypothetical protein